MTIGDPPLGRCYYWPDCNCGMGACDGSIPSTTHAPMLADAPRKEPMEEIRDGLSLIIQKLEELKVGVQAIDTKQDTVWNGQHLLVQEIQALGEKIALLGSTGYSRRKGSEFRFGDDNGAGG
jgi:hypothetical protein